MATATRTVDEQIFDTVEDLEPVTPGEIARRSGVAYTVTRAALARLARAGRVRSVGDRKNLAYWTGVTIDRVEAADRVQRQADEKLRGQVLELLSGGGALTEDDLAFLTGVSRDDVAFATGHLLLHRRVSMSPDGRYSLAASRAAA